MTPTAFQVHVTTMAIDTSGDYWKGTDPSDIDEYLADYTREQYPADRCVHAKCACGADSFQLEVDPDESTAKRVCASCAAEALMLDAAEYWEDSAPAVVECACGSTIHEVAVGFSHREDGSVKWVTIGVRCVGCGILGSPADWKIDYDPTEHLYQQV